MESLSGLQRGRDVATVMRIPAGEMTEQVMLRAQSKSDGPQGTVDREPKDIELVYAKMEPLTQRELELEPLSTDRVTIDWYRGLTTEWQMRWTDGETGISHDLHIDSAIDPGRRHILHVLKVHENTGEEA